MSELLTIPNIDSGARASKLIFQDNNLSVILDLIPRFHNKISESIHPIFQRGKMLYLVIGKRVYKLGKILSKNGTTILVGSNGMITPNQIRQWIGRHQTVLAITKFGH